MRYVIAHGHIFKNAGTSFDSALRGAFGEGFLDHRDDAAMRNGGAAHLRELLERNPTLKAISSHHLCSPLPQESDICYLPVYFLRDPIERVVSVYNFERKQPISTLGSKMAKEMNLIDYVRWRLEPGVPPTIRNFQTLYIGETRQWKRGLEANLDSLKIAMAVLKHKNTSFGLVEDFARGFNEIAAKLATYFPENSFEYETRNINSDLDSQEKAEQAYRMLAPVMEELIEANLFDIALYQYARSKFFNSLPDENLNVNKVSATN